MCTAAINITTKSLKDIDNAEVLLKIKGFIAMFIQTMEVSMFPCKTKIRKRKKRKNSYINLTVTDCV